MDDTLAGELDALRAQGLFRERRPVVTGRDGPRLTLADGRTLVSFCSNDYLGLAQHPRVTAGAAEAMARFGAGSTASRLVTGELAVHRELEAALTEFTGREAASVFPSGFQANGGVIGALAGKGDLVLSDARNHASIVDACRAARATIRVYDHADPQAAAAILAAEGTAHRRRLIVTDAVFSMTGAVAPVPDLLEVAGRHDAWLVVDEAHSMGVLGARGRGVAEHFGLPAGAIHATVVTFGKAFGAQGGAVTGSRTLADLVRNRARAFVYTTALAPGAAGATRAALELLAEDAGRIATLRDRTAQLRQALGMPGVAPIVAVVAGTPAQALQAAQTLESAGLLAVAMRPPTVPPGESGLRITVSAAHAPAEIDRLVAALAAAGVGGKNGAHARESGAEAVAGTSTSGREL